jgi:hypothetical protein
MPSIASANTCDELESAIEYHYLEGNRDYVRSLAYLALYNGCWW